ncbi:pilus assembly protein TadG-related protein [Pseudarthrobacter sp. YAF2]|uniref:pilus assembly protein TadG-related protein n=1 Tax=Pseudarthrobacter sp. YAF2 TaxID=3233078 RepID=UPI003F98860F
MKKESERGAVAVMVALLLVVLLGFGALALDVGMLYAQKAQLQNGADAAALAIAQDCAKRGLKYCQPDAAATALQYAKANTNSGMADAPAPTFPAAGTVIVNTAARDANGPGLTLWLANIFGISRADVGATSTAKWGGPSAMTTALPVAFSDCQFDLSGATQVLVVHGPKCASHNPSGQLIPGGFGWLTPDNGNVCGATVTIAKPALQGSNGNAVPNAVCKTAFSNLQGQTVLLPVFDTVTSSGDYNIKGFAAFQMLGYRFPSMSWNNTGNPSCTGQCFGIIGKFVKYVTLADLPLGGADLGADVVKLSL